VSGICVSGVDGKNRARRFTDDALCSGSQEDPFKEPMPVPSDDDQIRTPLLGHLQDFVGGCSMPDEHFNGKPRSPRLRQGLHRMAANLGFELLIEVGRE
jgi:hypothetical protein